jgi:protein TonB
VGAQFPEAARLAGIRDGTATLECLIRKDGTVSMIQVTDSSGQGFDENARKALEQWRFRPGTKDGQPVNVRLSVLFKFHLT